MSSGSLLSLKLPCLLVRLFPALISPALIATRSQGADSTPPAVLTPEEASRQVRLPDGFHATLFASEPGVVQPVAMNFDDRGRLWVVEMLTYADLKTNFDLTLHDRIVILEDTDHDGRSDKRTVFWDGGQRVTSVEVGFGGVWVLAAPQMLFIPDRNGDDVPDGPPEVLLDGWDAGPVRHNIVNGLKWGPDGWLYGRHGIQATSAVGKPGAPASERVRLNCCIWRYHPTRKTFEVVCQGGTNPWGHDWDELGNLWFINTVIGHLWQGIPGAWFKRMYGEHLAPNRYELIDQHADHYHWNTSKSWTDSREGGSGADALGGGHAHSGLMIYLGDNWPANYRNELFTLNFHGRRINHDHLAPEGSGLIGRHGPDFAFFADTWFRGVDLAYGPDGGVFVLDWSDRGECHENDADGVHRETGRIFKIVYGAPREGVLTNVAALAGADLVRLQSHPNEWFARHARRVLQERASQGKDLRAEQAALKSMFLSQTNAPGALRALWALRAAGGAGEDWLRAQLNHSDAHVRAWLVTLLCEGQPVPQELALSLTNLTQSERSPVVRLALASALQRLAFEDRPALAGQLAAHSEDASDHNLPLLLWYGIEPAVSAGLPAAKSLYKAAQIPQLRRLIIRRIAEGLEKNPGDTDEILRWAILQSSPQIYEDVLRGLTEALKGWRRAARPTAWQAFTDAAKAAGNAQIAQWIRELNVVFGDGRAVTEVRQLAANSQAPAEARRAAVRQVIEARIPDLDAWLESLLRDGAVAGAAARGLAISPDANARLALYPVFGSLSAEDQGAVVAQLVTRAASARELLSAIGTGRVPRNVLNAMHARQILRFDDPVLREQLAQVWGEVRDTDADKQERMKRFKNLLSGDTLQQAQLANGRVLFDKVCAVCHRLYGEGQTIGPDLTGSGRSDLDYLLENIVDPSAIVPADYRVSNLELKDDRSLTGVIVGQSERTIELQLQNERVTIDRRDIASMQQGTLSLMPEGLLDGLQDEEIRDLIGYLRHPEQVPLPRATARP